MKEILDFCVSFFRNPSLFMGLVVAIGLILQRKPIDAILKGIFKGIIGMVILLKGVDIVVSSITPKSLNTFIYPEIHHFIDFFS